MFCLVDGKLLKNLKQGNGMIIFLAKKVLEAVWRKNKIGIKISFAITPIKMKSVCTEV